HARGFPIISCMAHDFLAVPAMLVLVEHLFSKLHHVYADMCSFLKAATISQLMFAKFWL
ncbi:hypothetical protein HETIRDRAFT_321683, partial [Heterobasidion irregulare TC 32-1]